MSDNKPYYVAYDDQGRVIGFFNDNQHTSIPINSIALTEAEWQTVSGQQYRYHIDPVTRTLVDTGELPLYRPPDWQALATRFRGSPLFAKVWDAAIADAGVNRALTLMLTTINSANPDLNDLEFALMSTIEAMGTRLTPADLAQVQSALDECGFQFKVTY